MKPDFLVMCFPRVQHFTLHDSAQLKEEKGMKQHYKKEFQENDIFFLQRELKRLYSIWNGKRKYNLHKLASLHLERSQIYFNISYDGYMVNNNMQNIGAERFLCVWNYFMEKTTAEKKSLWERCQKKCSIGNRNFQTIILLLFWQQYRKFCSSELSTFRQTFCTINNFERNYRGNFDK